MGPDGKTGPPISKPGVERRSTVPGGIIRFFRSRPADSGSGLPSAASFAGAASSTATRLSWGFPGTLRHPRRIASAPASGDSARHGASRSPSGLPRHRLFNSARPRAHCNRRRLSRPPSPSSARLRLVSALHFPVQYKPFVTGSRSLYAQTHHRISKIPAGYLS